MEEFTLLLHCTSKAQADAVLECFEPCDDISGDIVPDGDFRRDWELLLDRATGMFAYQELAEDEILSVKSLVDADPAAPFRAQLLILSDSYEENLMADCTYQDGELQVQTIETVESLLAECPECGEELEHEIELKDHRHGKVYTCPTCGAEFSFEEIFYSEETITDFEGSEEGEDSPDDEDLTDELPGIWLYEFELEKKGLLPDAKHGMDAVGSLPRVCYMVKQGDAKAKQLLDQHKKTLAQLHINAKFDA